MIAKFVAVAAAAFLVAGQAQAADAAAQLSAVQGKVMVSRDGKLAAAAAGALKTGDRVIAMAGGQAQLKYADGCVVSLTPQAMATIAVASPCASGAGLIRAAGSASAQTAPQGMSALQWTGVGLTAVVLGVGLVAAADDISISN